MASSAIRVPTPAAWSPSDSLARGAALLLIGLQAALALTHSPWSDETQAWQLAAWTASWSDLLTNLHYEGHPVVWYALLRLVSAISHKPIVLAATQAVIAACGLAILLVRAPFPIWHRLALGASYLLLFEYGTIARSYGLGVLLLYAFLALRRHPVSWLLLAVMANISFHFMLLSAGCWMAVWVLERRISWPGLAVWALGCLIMIGTVWPAPDIVPAVPLRPDMATRIDRAFEELGALLVPGDLRGFPLGWPAMLRAPAAIPIALVLVGLLAISLMHDRRLWLIGGGLLGVVVAMSLTTYPMSMRHAGVVVLFVIAADWIAADREGRAPHLASRLWAIIGAAFGLAMAASCLSAPFSSGRQLANWVSAQGLRDEPWAAYTMPQGSLVSAEIGRPVYQLRAGCFARFTRWNAAARPFADAEELADAALAGAAALGGTMLLAVENGAEPAPRSGIVAIKSFPPSILPLHLTVFRITTTPGTGPRPGPCPWAKD